MLPIKKIIEAAILTACLIVLSFHFPPWAAGRVASEAVTSSQIVPSDRSVEWYCLSLLVLVSLTANKDSRQLERES